MRNEELIENIRQSHPDADKAAADLTKAKFELSKTTKSTCLEFLSENDVELESWIGDVRDNEKVMKILKLWFSLSTVHNRESWCAFPAIIDDDTFYSGAKIVLISEATILCKKIHLPTTYYQFEYVKLFLFI